jgi:hypothetical protein
MCRHSLPLPRADETDPKTDGISSAATMRSEIPGEASVRGPAPVRNLSGEGNVSEDDHASGATLLRIPAGRP